MGKVIDLHDYKAHALDRRAFGAWRRRFDLAFDRHTTVEDLADDVLIQLAPPGDESTAAFYELIMGVLAMGPEDEFQLLDSEQKLSIVDRHLFLADQVRFEMLCRLDWILPFACRQIPLLKLVTSFPHFKDTCRQTPPELSTNHPGYADFQALIPKDRSSYIRRLLPEALDAFRKNLL